MILNGTYCPYCLGEIKIDNIIISQEVEFYYDENGDKIFNPKKNSVIILHNNNVIGGCGNEFSASELLTIKDIRKLKLNKLNE